MSLAAIKEITKHLFDVSLDFRGGAVHSWQLRRSIESHLDRL
jgi:hypothetical protein